MFDYPIKASQTSVVSEQSTQCSGFAESRIVNSQHPKTILASRDITNNTSSNMRFTKVVLLPPKGTSISTREDELLRTGEIDTQPGSNTGAEAPSSAKRSRSPSPSMQSVARRPAGKRPRLTPAPSSYVLSTVRVQVGAGNSAKEFFLPRDALCAASEDFKTSLQKDKDGVTTILNLQRDDPLIFAIFSEYLVGEDAGSICLLSEGVIDCAVCGQHQVEDSDERTLVELYIFANRHSIPEFKALVLQNVLEYFYRSTALPSSEAMTAVKVMARNKYDDLYLLMLAIWLNELHPCDGSDTSEIEQQAVDLPDPLKVDMCVWQDRIGGNTFDDPALDAAAERMDDLYYQVWSMWEDWTDCEHPQPQDTAF